MFSCPLRVTVCDLLVAIVSSFPTLLIPATRLSPSILMRFVYERFMEIIET